jgi:hypothetical protein
MTHSIRAERSSMRRKGDLTRRLQSFVRGDRNPTPRVETLTARRGNVTVRDRSLTARDRSCTEGNMNLARRFHIASRRSRER